MFANNRRTLKLIPLKDSFSAFILFRSFATAQKKICPYEILGVRPNATFFDIKQAYYIKGNTWIIHSNLNF